MGVYVEVEKNTFLREIRDSGKSELPQSQLETKFGPRPLWVAERLAKR